MAHYFPNLLGGALPPGDMGHTRLTGLLVFINYPALTPLFLVESDPTYGWPPVYAQLFQIGFLILLFLCLGIYWYLEGCIAHTLFRKARNSNTRAGT
jgi:hypothetical protein